MAFMYGFIGANGCGKTQTIKRIIKKWLKSNPNGKLYIHDCQNDYSEFKAKFITPDKKSEWIQDVLKYNNVLIILDELRVVHPNNELNDNFIELLARWRKKNINIVFTVHYPKLLIERMTAFTTEYFIYFNYGKKADFMSKMDDYLTPYKMSIVINRYRALVGSKLEYKSLYPKFPYMIVNPITDQVYGINLNSKLYKQALANK